MVIVETGRLTTDDEELLGVTVKVVSTDGGYNPPNPFVNISSVTFTDVLVFEEGTLGIYVKPNLGVVGFRTADNTWVIQD